MKARGYLCLLVALAPLIASCEDRNFHDAKEAVRRQLKDPDSANFREVRRCGNSDVITGEVNAKNSYGAFSGFEVFHYADGVAELGYEGSLVRRCTDAIKQSTEAIINTLSENAQARLRNEFESEGLGASAQQAADDVTRNTAAPGSAGPTPAVVDRQDDFDPDAPDVSREEEAEITANYVGD